MSNESAYNNKNGAFSETAVLNGERIVLLRSFGASKHGGALHDMHKLNKEYQPKTGERCHHKTRIELINCPTCEGTGWKIDFRLIRERITFNPPVCKGRGN
jgi:hypothetical protein